MRSALWIALVLALVTPLVMAARMGALTRFRSLHSPDRFDLPCYPHKCKTPPFNPYGPNPRYANMNAGMFDFSNAADAGALDAILKGAASGAGGSAGVNGTKGEGSESSTAAAAAAAAAAAKAADATLDAEKDKLRRLKAKMRGLAKMIAGGGAAAGLGGKNAALLAALAAGDAGGSGGSGGPDGFGSSGSESGSESGESGGNAKRGVTLSAAPRLHFDAELDKPSGGGCPCIPSKPGECACPADDIAELLKEDQRKIRHISKRIRKDEDDLDKFQNWLDNALHKRKKLVRQMEIVNITNTDLIDEIADLKEQRSLLKRKIKRDMLERDLKMAHDSLARLARKQQKNQEKKDELKAEAEKVEDKLNSVSGHLSKSIGVFETLAKKIGVTPVILPEDDTHNETWWKERDFDYHHKMHDGAHEGEKLWEQRKHEWELREFPRLEREREAHRHHHHRHHHHHPHGEEAAAAESSEGSASSSSG